MMPKKVYSEEQYAWTIKNFSTYPDSVKLSKAFSERFDIEISPSKMRSLCKNLNLRRNNQNKYTKKQNEWLIKNHESKSFSKLASEFNAVFGTCVTSSAISNHCQVYLDLRYANPQAFNNKIPANKKDIGTERIDKRSGSILIKTEDGWVYKARYIYEKHYGKIENKQQVIQLDGNKHNFSIDNLKSVPLKYMVMLNRNKWLGKGEISKTALLYCELHYLDR